MDPADTLEREPGHPAPQRSTLSLALWSMVFVAALASLFLLGCFVLGPWLRTQAQTARQVALLPPAGRHPAEHMEGERPLKLPKPLVKIRETAPPSKTEPEPAATVTEEASTDADTSASQPALTPPVVQTPGPDSPGDAGQLYRVKVGLFADRTHADAMSQKLSDAGFSPSVLEAQGSGRVLYSVQAGAFRNRENADGLVGSLKQSGFEAWVSTDE